jgi:hypothetical protein
MLTLARSWAKWQVRKIRPLPMPDCKAGDMCHGHTMASFHWRGYYVKVTRAQWRRSHLPVPWR